MKEELSGKKYRAFAVITCILQIKMLAVNQLQVYFVPRRQQVNDTKSKRRL